MTTNQRELLVGIQALALVVPHQTGMRASHEVRTDVCKVNGRVYVVSDVRVMDRDLQTLYSSTANIDESGRDEPTRYEYLPPGTDYGERTLTQQRDELAEFIASHRKQEAA